MTHQNNGVPAFPVDELNQQTGFVAVQHMGITIRDYFAAKTISAVLAPHPVTGQFALVSDFDACAIMAYKMADAMLRVRQSK